MSGSDRFDFVIIGSGFGGATAAHVLLDTGASILILERGGFLPQEKQNWDVGEVSVRRRYDAGETWFDERSRPFSPRIYYNVGGCSKVFGAAALRFRAEDSLPRRHSGGETPGWPFTYQELKPYYDRAERLLHVHGLKGTDPTEPDRGDFPFAPIPHEPVIAEFQAINASTIQDEDGDFSDWIEIPVGASWVVVEVTVLTARYRLDLPRDEQVINGVRVVRLWAPIRLSRGMLMPAYPWAAWGLTCWRPSRPQATIRSWSPGAIPTTRPITGSLSTRTPRSTASKGYWTSA